MKTKLLKKVRNRYEIEYVTKVSPTSIYYGMTPYFNVVDKETNYNVFVSINDAGSYELGYNDAYDMLIYLIRQEYKHTKKKIIYHYNKVWYS
jgi:hypothetical protein